MTVYTSGDFELHNFVPLTTYASPTFYVEFDVVALADPVALSALDVDINALDSTVSMIVGGVGQDGFNVTITATSIDAKPGYHVLIVPSYTYSDASVTIYIDVDSSPSTNPGTFNQIFQTATYSGYIVSVTPDLGNLITTATAEPVIGLSFTGKSQNILFQLNDASEPVVTNRIPVVNSTDALPNTNIQLSVHDSGGEGINLSTFDVYIDGDQAIDGGNFVFPYTGSLVPDTIDGFEAYTAIIDPASNFLYEQWIPIRVVVQDLVADPAAVNTLDTTYQFRTKAYTDTTPPGIDPLQPPTGLGLDACIEFNWLDEPQGIGPDWDTLNVTLRRELTVSCITSIRDDIAVVNGIAAPGYTVYGTPIVIGEQIGFHVIICPAVPFNELETITVIVTGQDIGGESSSSSFSISTLETTPPTILNLNPVDGAVGVATDAPIIFNMHDSAGVGVDIDSVSVNIDDSEAVINGVVQPGFSLWVVNDRIIDQFGLDFDGYEFMITRDIPFTPGKQISVEIDGYDGYGNRATPEVYSFTIEPDTTPPTVSFYPEAGTEGLNRNQIVIVDVVDNLGVNKFATNIWVQDQPAVQLGVPVAPFDVTISDIITVPGLIDGYRYVVDTELDFGFNELVVTSVQATDIYGNSSATSSSFRTFIDVISPTITGMFPRDGQEEVSLSPTIGFTLRDGYDIAYELTHVTVNGEEAIKNGLPQSGYSVATSRISGGTPGIEPGDGYNVYVTRTEGFDYNATIAVYVEAYDRSLNNKTTETATWYTIAPEPPRFDTVLQPGDTNVPLDTNCVFEVFQDGYGLDISTLYFGVSGNDIIVNGVIQGPDYSGVIQEIYPDSHYRIAVSGRYLLTSSTDQTFHAQAEESTSGNLTIHNFVFTTQQPLENSERLYIGTASGVVSVKTNEIDGYTQTSSLIDGYYVHDLSSEVLNEVNKLAIATRDNGAVLLSTNYVWPTVSYSVGDEITKIHITDKNNGTLYLANRTKRRVDVYYNLLADDFDRSTPDVYYDAVRDSEDGYAVEGLLDGYFTDMVVIENMSPINSDSVSIFLGTPTGVFRLDTDEGVPGESEINGQVTSYGIPGSGYDYNVLGGNTNKVVAIDVNTRLNHLYVATRSDEAGSINALTYIDLTTNTRSGVMPETMLIHRLINDIDFQD